MVARGGSFGSTSEGERGRGRPDVDEALAADRRAEAIVRC